MDDLDLIYEFLMECESGSSYWVDLKGTRHCADIGYVLEFLIDMRGYIQDVGGMEEFKRLWNEYKAHKMKGEK